MKKRIWLTLLFVFVIAGAISCTFNILLEGENPVVQFFSGGFFTAVVYRFFTFLLWICKNELKIPSKVFLSFTHAFCIFSIMGCTSIIYTKRLPIWWMYLVWIFIALFISWKSYRDAKKVNF